MKKSATYSVTYFGKGQNPKQKPVTKTYPFTADPAQFVADLKAGKTYMWHRKDFGRRDVVKMPNVHNYVGPNFSSGSQRSPEFVIDLSNAFDANFKGEPTYPVAFFKDLHKRLIAAIDNEFTKQEIMYIDASITDCPDRDPKYRKYLRSFAASHVHAAK